MFQSLGHTLNVKLRRQKKNEHSTSKVSNVHDLHYTTLSNAVDVMARRGRGIS